MWVCRRCGERSSDLLSACPACAGLRTGRALGDLQSCESCGARVEAGVRRCEGCERSLAEAVEPPAVPAGRLVKVWSSTNATEAELLRVELRRAGVESFLENENGISCAIGLPTSLIPLVISVADTQVSRALEILRAERDRAPADRYIPPVAMVSFVCVCGKTLEVPPDFQGLEMDCPFCGRLVTAGKAAS
jgi:hypothetical protein